MADHLARAGLEIIDRNVELGGGEIDLVARSERDEPTIVFIEVRSREHDDLGDPLETIDRIKQRKVIRAATAWLLEHDLWEKIAVRFDVVGVTAPGSGRPHMAWIENAFETC